jgi:hypothetical protein
MCYGEFNDVIEAIARYGCRTSSPSKRRARTWSCCRTFSCHPNDIGPGVYSHLRVPDSLSEMDQGLLRKAAQLIPAERRNGSTSCRTTSAETSGCFGEYGEMLLRQPLRTEDGDAVNERCVLNLPLRNCHGCGIARSTFSTRILMEGCGSAVLRCGDVMRGLILLTLLL